LFPALTHFHFYRGVVRFLKCGDSLTESPRRVQFFLYPKSENALELKNPLPLVEKLPGFPAPGKTGDGIRTAKYAAAEVLVRFHALRMPFSVSVFR
jgi:hypothetical protein